MDAFGGFKETIEDKDVAKERPLKISAEANEKFDAIMQDETKPNFTESVSKFLNMSTEKSVSSQTDQADNDVNDTNEYEPDFSENNSGEPEAREPNSVYELDGSIFETDDNGKTYKKNDELLPNTEYMVNGNCYKTDENGHQVSCDSNPVYTDEGSRNVKEQQESGGEERRDDDDGGHIIAKILGGAEGAENLVPMRRTINRGDYKKMENEISKALQEGKQVTVHIDLTYKGASQRPSKIHAEYIIDGKKTAVEFDNDENSTELLDTLDTKVEDDDLNSLKAEIEDMASEGVFASVTSVKIEYDGNGAPVNVTVGLLDESTGEKTYKCFSPRKE